MTSISYLSREGECVGIITNDGVNDKDQLSAKWQQIHDREKSVRYDAKVYTHLQLQLPNSWSDALGEEKVAAFLKSSKIKDQDYAAFLHKGERGEVEKNFHVHLIYNERSRETGKKDRSMSKLGFQKDFVKEFQQLYGKEIQATISKMPKVERIPMYQWKAAPELARTVKAALREEKKQEYGKRIERAGKSFEELAGAFRSVSGGQQKERGNQPSKQRATGKSHQIDGNGPKIDLGRSRGIVHSKANKLEI